VAHRFVPVNEFTPNNGDWVPAGTVTSHQQTGRNILSQLTPAGMALQVSFLGPLCVRVRFSPISHPNYNQELSYAVVNRDLGNVTLNVVNNGDHLMIDTGSLQVRIDLKPYRLQVFRNNQLICADEPTYNLVYYPNASVVANFKTYPANARYCGFGERAGDQLFKNQTSLNFFNFDNYAYAAMGRWGTGDPRDPSLPLYCSIPLLIEVNPNPVGANARPYAYGLFLDNPAQSFFNIGFTDYGRSMYGKYYFGSLYGEMDYYLMAGDYVADVLKQYTALTGRAPLPPRYALGFHQGAYGYYDHTLLMNVAQGYRASKIPVDGLHIDIDFQNNYRVFTSSKMKFPNTDQIMAALHANGFKWSTNITALVKNDSPQLGDLDEDGQPTPYTTRDALVTAGAMIPEQYEGQPPGGRDYLGHCTYGPVANPYPAPPHERRADGTYDANIAGRYPNIFGAAGRQTWGDQYRHLLYDLLMDMVWQDMQCPAVDQFRDYKSLPLDLMLDRGDGIRVPHAYIHNAYGLNMLRATWEGLGRLRQNAPDAGVRNARNFIIARGGYAGMQRYAALWTGDSPADRRYLSTLIPQVLNLGLSGVPISGSDVGGFSVGADSTQPNARNVTHYVVFVRWLQISAFLPWFRDHYTAYDKDYQEPYRYPEPVPTCCRKIIELRYRLMPLFYDAMYECTQSGVPVCRPLFLNDPGDVNTYDHVNDQFYVGRDFLVAPIVPAFDPSGLSENATREVYLPADGPWYGFGDSPGKLGTPVPGGTLLTGPTVWRATLDQVPIYVRAGAILPMRTRAEQYVGQLHVNPLVLNIYPGPDRSYRMYLDDGITREADDQGAYRLVEIAQQTAGRVRRVSVNRRHDQYKPPESYFTVALLGSGQPTGVTLNGQPLTSAPYADQLATSGSDGYFWDSTAETTYVQVMDNRPQVTIQIT